jgi:hypothetical protein
MYFWLPKRIPLAIIILFYPENKKKQRLHESHQMAGAYSTFYFFVLGELELGWLLSSG